MTAAREPTSPLAEQLGKLLIDAREARGLSLRALAREVGVSPVTLSYYETGRHNPTLSKVYELADQYGIQVTITRHGRRPRKTTPTATG